jgi:hypothetical protein
VWCSFMGARHSEGCLPHQTPLGGLKVAAECVAFDVSSRKRVALPEESYLYNLLLISNIITVVWLSE